MGETIRIQAAAGDTDTYVAPARPTPGRPVLLLHAWWGLKEPFKDLADRLAGDGFTVMAPDLFDGTVLTTIEEAEAHLDEVNPDRTIGRVGAALDNLLAHPDVTGERAGVIGLSLGAMYATRLASARPEVAAVVAFYGGGFDPPGNPAQGTRPAYLGHFAEDDPYEDVAELPRLQRALNGGSEAHRYPGTQHWFFEADRPEFDAEASSLAYARTVAFLDEQLA